MLLSTSKQNERKTYHITIKEGTKECAFRYDDLVAAADLIRAFDVPLGTQMITQQDEIVVAERFWCTSKGSLRDQLTKDIKLLDAAMN